MSYPASVTFYGPLPEAKIGKTVEVGSELTKGENIANLTTAQGKLGAFFYELAGSAGADGTGRVKSKSTFYSKEFISGERKTWLYLEWTLEKTRHATTFYARQLNGEKFGWKFISVKVLGSGGGFSKDSKIEIKRGSESTASTEYDAQSPYADTNPFVANHPDGDLEYSGAIFTVNGITKNVGLAARSQAYRWEVFGSVSGFRAGQTKTVT